MTVGSLFSGIGGLELGLEMCEAGPVIWQCDSDPYARAVLEHHWPTVHRYNDVREIDASAARVELICGGFPCQPHSHAGGRLGTNDARWLWPEFARIIGILRPRFVFIENVRGLRTSGLRTVLADLARLGFDAEWQCFSAADVWAPHERERLFTLAYAAGEGLERREETAAPRKKVEKPANRPRWAAEPDVGRVGFPPGHTKSASLAIPASRRKRPSPGER